MHALSRSFILDTLFAKTVFFFFILFSLLKLSLCQRKISLFEQLIALVQIEISASTNKDIFN